MRGRRSALSCLPAAHSALTAGRVDVSRRILLELRVPDRGVRGVDLLLQLGEEPGEVGQHQRPLLRGHLVLLSSELVEKLLPHSLKHRLQQRPATIH